MSTMPKTIRGTIDAFPIFHLSSHFMRTKSLIKYLTANGHIFKHNELFLGEQHTDRATEQK